MAGPNRSAIEMPSRLSMPRLLVVGFALVVKLLVDALENDLGSIGASSVEAFGLLSAFGLFSFLLGSSEEAFSLRRSFSSLRLICSTCSGFLGACAAGPGAFGLLGCGLPDPAIGPWGSSMGHSDRAGEFLSLEGINDY